MTQNKHSLIIQIILITIVAFGVNSKILYMSNVYRHGARYPVHDFYDYNQTKQYSGLLTTVGLRQHYLLGSYIRNQYVKSKNPLLNATLKPRQIQLFTMITSTERCQQSSYAQAFGIFSLQDGQVLQSNLDPNILLPPFQTIFPDSLKSQQAPDNFALEKGFQPTPVRYATTYFPDCQHMNVILSRRGQVVAKDLAIFQAQNAAFTQKMRLLFNLSVSQANLAGVADLADVLIADKWLNRDLPTSFTDYDYRQIYYIRSYLTVSLYSGEVAQIVNTPFINALLQNMELKTKGKLGIKKMSSYSVHDLNVIPLLTYYNMTSPECLKKSFKNQTLTTPCAQPLPFASNLMFELHQRDAVAGQFFVKVRYNGEYYKLFGKNSTQIQFKEFVQKSRANLLDFNKQCNGKTQQMTQVIVEE